MKKSIKCTGWDQAYSERTGHTEIQGDWEQWIDVEVSDGIDDDHLAREAWTEAEAEIEEYDDENCIDTCVLSEILVHGENGWFSVDRAHKYPSYLEKIYCVHDNDASEVYDSYDSAVERADEWIDDRYADARDSASGCTTEQLCDEIRRLGRPRRETGDYRDVHVVEITPKLYDGFRDEITGYWPDPDHDEGCEEVECIGLDDEMILEICRAALHSRSDLWIDRYYVMDDGNLICCDDDGYGTEEAAEAAAAEAAAADGKSRWVMYCELQEQPELVLCCEVEP